MIPTDIDSAAADADLQPAAEYCEACGDRIAPGRPVLVGFDLLCPRCAGREPAAADAVQPAAPRREEITAAALDLARIDHQSHYVIRLASGAYDSMPMSRLTLDHCAESNATIVATVHYGRPRPIQNAYQRGETLFTHPEQTRAELDAHNAMIRASYAAESARNALLRSKGHRMIANGYEYYTDDRRDGALFSAPDGRPLDADGYRNGGRYVCSAKMADYMIAAAVATQEAITQADKTNTPRYVWRMGDMETARFFVTPTDDAPDPLAIRYTTIAPAAARP